MLLRKLSQTIKISIALMLSVLSTGILQAVPASAYSATNPGDAYKKVWVCKYVGTPGVNESLKKGNDGLISVSINSILDKERDGVHVGDKFSDKHDHSIVIAWDDEGAAPSTTVCPAADDGDNETTPLPSGIADNCGPNNDTIPMEDTSTYTVTADSGWDNGSRTIVYEAVDGLVFSDNEGWTISDDGKTATYVFTDWNTPCNVTPTGELDIDTTCEKITLDSLLITPSDGTVSYEIDGVDASAGDNVATVGSHKVELFVNGTEVAEETVIVSRCTTACSVSDHYYTQEWTYDNASYPDAADYSYVEGVNIVNNATYEFKADGLHLATPDQDSSVYGLIDAGSTPIQDVNKMSYETFRKAESSGYEYTVPAYILVVDINGAEEGGLKYFFYEPYNNSAPHNDSPLVQEGKWQTWDTIDGGNAIWWMSGTKQALHTWSYFVEQNPNAVILAYGFNQGTYNTGTYSAVQSLEFDCATTTFGKPAVLGDQTGDNTGGGLGGGHVLSTTAPVKTAALPATIPATGKAMNPFIILVASLAAYGAAYFAQGRRRVTDI